MDTGRIRLLLGAWGALAAAVLIGELIRLDALTSVGPGWTLAYLATFLAGAWATRAEPSNRAAVRLQVFGCAGLTFLAVSSWELLVAQAGHPGTGLLLLNAAAQVAGLLMVCAQTAALVRYPDGVARLAAERWTVLGFAVLAGVLPVLLLLTRPRMTPAWILDWNGLSSGAPVPVLDSPWYVPALGGLGEVMHTLDQSAIVVGTLIGAALAAIRYRLLEADQRHRMAWPVLAAGVLLLGVLFNAAVEGSGLPRVAGDAVEIVCYLVLPVALGIGIAAPGLLDALGTVRRTGSFAVLSLAVLGLYVATAGLLGITLGGHDLRVAVLVALLAALALEPVRRSLVRRASRFAFGQEISRDELLLRLGDTLEHTMDREALTESIAEAAMEGLGTQWVLLSPDGAAPVHVGRDPWPGERPALTARLLHGQDDRGEISCGPLGGQSRRRSRMQLATLARQIAMALSNARLAGELNQQVAEIEASRHRLVTAEETARRRLERDLHDGAQQDIAALLTRIALAQNQLGRGQTDRLATTLATLHADAGQALQNLRELVSGIHEATLADQGLVTAVEGRVAKMPIPVNFSYGPGVRAERLAPPVESAAFFTVCEALANTLKHGQAQRATISMALDGGRLRIDVGDDGRGFDPHRTNGSRGLSGIRDRIAAVGGTFEVRSTPGSGTTLSAVVPVLAR